MYGGQFPVTIQEINASVKNFKANNCVERKFKLLERYLCTKYTNI